MNHKQELYKIQKNVPMVYVRKSRYGLFVSLMAEWQVGDSFVAKMEQKGGIYGAARKAGQTVNIAPLGTTMIRVWRMK